MDSLNVIHASSSSLHRVIYVVLCDRRRPIDFRYGPLATEVVWRCNMSRRANSAFVSRLGAHSPFRTTVGTLHGQHPADTVLSAGVPYDFPVHGANR